MQLAANSSRFRRFRSERRLLGELPKIPKARRECPLINKSVRAGEGVIGAPKSNRCVHLARCLPKLARTRNFRGMHGHGILSSISRVSRGREQLFH